MHDINLLLFNFINGGAGYYSSLDTFILFLTSYLAYGISIATGLYVLVWRPFIRKDPRARLRALGSGFELAFAGFCTWLIVKIIKVVVAYPRPFQTLKDIQVLSPYESGYSFPSGHSSMTAAVATVVYFYDKRLGVLLYGFALLVGISRIYVGVHYPIDVAVGLLLGFFIPLGIHRVFFPRRKKDTIVSDAIADEKPL